MNAQIPSLSDYDSTVPNVIILTPKVIPSCFWLSHPTLPHLMQHQIHPCSYTLHPQHHCVRNGHNQTPETRKDISDTSLLFKGLQLTLKIIKIIKII